MPTTLPTSPTLGIDANALYVGANMADSNGNIVNATLFVIRKSSVTGAGPIVVSAFRNLDNAPSYSAGPFSPQGASNDDPAATSGYVVGVDFAFFGLLDVLRVGSPGNADAVGNLQVSVPQTFFPKTVTVVGSSKPLDAGDDRLSAVSIVGERSTRCRTSASTRPGMPCIADPRRGARVPTREPRLDAVAHALGVDLRPERCGLRRTGCRRSP